MGPVADTLGCAHHKARQDEQTTEAQVLLAVKPKVCPEGMTQGMSVLPWVSASMKPHPTAKYALRLGNERTSPARYDLPLAGDVM